MIGKNFLAFLLSCHPERSEGPMYSAARCTGPSLRSDDSMDLCHERAGRNTSLSRLRKSRSRPFNFFKHGAAALAHRGIVLVLADMGRVVPAALALLTIGFLDLDMDAARAVHRALREPD